MTVNWEDLNSDLQNILEKYRDYALEPYWPLFRSKLMYKQYSSGDRDNKLSLKGLKQCLKFKNDKIAKMNVASEIDGNQQRLQFKWSKEDKQLVKKLMINQFGHKWNPSGLFLNPKEGGFCGWHTNSDKTMPIIYFVWVEKENSSWFYTSQDGSKIITVSEPKGWSINLFKPPIWHGLKSDCIRFSIGFRQMEGKAIWLDQEK